VSKNNLQKKSTSKSKNRLSAEKSQKKSAILRPFPRVPLEKALTLAYLIKDMNGGNPWSTEDVAAAANLSIKSESFFYLTAASRDYGLTEGTRNTEKISLTDEGKELVYAASPEQEYNLKVRAFFNAELFKRVLEHFKGSNLPEMKYLSNTLSKEFGLHPDVHDEFSKIFAANCRYLEIGSGFSLGAELNSSTAPLVHDRATVILAETGNNNAPVCFVIMPFKEREPSRPLGFFDEVLRSLIVPAGSAAGFSVKTANRTGSDVIQATIVNDLLNADLVIADLTEHNPNVLFELGMRMAEDKPVVLIRAKGTLPIFDVDNMLRVEDYNPNLWSSTIEDDLPKLQEHIKATWEDRDKRRSYMQILRQSIRTEEA